MAGLNLRRTLFGGNDIAIDLGTANTLIYVKGVGVVVDEPTLLAVNKDDQSILTIGKEAKKLVGRVPDSIELIRDKWNEFVVEGLGCKCVKEEPWVTAAESAELVLALTKIGLKNEAEKILQDTFNLIDDDGLLWTGYVFKDKKYWPIEKPSWTMGAAILAGNSLNKFSPSSDFFEF